MAKNYYVSGSHNCICDVCGQKVKFEKTKLRWDGLLVCEHDYETRHPQDFVRAKTDKIMVPVTRPRQPDVFTNVSYIAFYVDSGYVEDKYFEEL